MDAEARLDDEALMREAIALAVGTRPHPNPRVGALVLDASGRIVGRGAHAGPGSPHAEVLALREAGERAAGGTLVVSLEPCDHEGRTPPCTAAVLAARVARVLVGAVDPDPQVAGRGIARLRAAGVEVRTDLVPEVAEALDPAYFHHRRAGRPRLTLKAALTLDGWAAAADGTSRWITSEEARADAHRRRAAADAVMVGAGTLRADNPSLDVRLPGQAGPQPRPVLVAGRQPLPPRARIWERDPLVLAPGPVDCPAEVVIVPGPDGVDLAGGLTAVGERGLLDVLAEGGPTLAGSLLRAGLVDRGIFYLGSRLGGGAGKPALVGAFATLAQARRVRIESVSALGPDACIEFTVEDE